MLRFVVSLTLLLSLSSVYAQSECQRLSLEINELHQEINSIIIPEMGYTVNEENCSLALPTMEAVYEIETRQMKLLDNYENLYFNCGKEVEIIYIIEDIKINILLMQTMTALAKDLDNKCRNAF